MQGPRSTLFATMAVLHLQMREYERAEMLGPRALEICENHHFPNEAASARCYLGLAQAHLSHATEGVALVRKGIAGSLEIGCRVGLPGWTICTAVQQCKVQCR